MELRNGLLTEDWLLKATLALAIGSVIAGSVAKCQGVDEVSRPVPAQLQGYSWHKVIPEPKAPIADHADRQTDSYPVNSIGRLAVTAR